MNYDIKPGAVIHGDCLTVLRQMEPDSVDMIITDPPYGVDYQSNSRTATAKLAKIANDKTPFIWWIYDAFRVLKDGGGSTLFQPLGCAAGIYGCPKTCRLYRQVRAGVGQS